MKFKLRPPAKKEVFGVALFVGLFIVIVYKNGESEDVGQKPTTDMPDHAKPEDTKTEHPTPVETGVTENIASQTSQTEAQPSQSQSFDSNTESESTIVPTPPPPTTTTQEAQEELKNKNETFILQHSYTLNRENPSASDVKVTCTTITSGATGICPTYMKTLSEIEKRSLISEYENESSVQASFAKNVITVNDFEYHTNIKMKQLFGGLSLFDSPMVRSSLDEGQAQDLSDEFDKNWSFGSIRGELRLSSNDSSRGPNVKDMKCVVNESANVAFLQRAFTCLTLKRFVASEDFLRNLTRREKAVMGAERLSGKIIVGVNRPWIVTQLTMTGQTNGRRLVRDSIEEFNKVELSMCKCYELDDHSLRKSCLADLNVSRVLQIVMDPPICNKLNAKQG